MKLNVYKSDVLEHLAAIFPDKENLKQQVKRLYDKGDFNDFEVYAAACIMHVVNRYTGYSLYELVMDCVPGVKDTHWITLYRAAFKDYVGCTLLECTK